MSLTEMIACPDAPVRALHSVRRPNVDDIMRLGPNSAGQKINREHPGEVDFSKAAKLLDRAWTTISHLTAGRLELDRRDEAAAEGIRQLQEQATGWERRAAFLKAQLEDAESKLSAKQVLIEALTHRATKADARALIAEQQSSDARHLLQAYHDKIIDTFGALA